MAEFLRKQPISKLQKLRNKVVGLEAHLSELKRFLAEREEEKRQLSNERIRLIRERRGKKEIARVSKLIGEKDRHIRRYLRDIRIVKGEIEKLREEIVRELEKG